MPGKVNSEGNFSTPPPFLGKSGVARRIKSVIGDRLSFAHVQRGQVLIIVSLVFVAVLAITTSALFSKTANFLRLGGNYTRAEKAVNVAEAGIEEALRQINANPAFTTTGATALGSTGTFIANVTGGASLKTITSTGFVPDNVNTREKRTIKVDAARVSNLVGTSSSISCTIPGFSGNPCVWSHTVPADLSDSRLIVGISVRGSTPVNYVTYGSTGGAANCPASGGSGDLTRITFADNPTHVRTEMWYLANPPAGSFDICVHMNTSASNLYVAAGASTWQGVTGFGAVNTDTGNSYPEVILGGPLGPNVAIDSIGVMLGNTVDPNTIQPQIEIYEQNITSPAPGQVTGAGSYIADSPLSTTTQWTPSGVWAGIAVRILPVVADSWRIKKGTYRFVN